MGAIEDHPPPPAAMGGAAGTGRGPRAPSPPMTGQVAARPRNPRATKAAAAAAHGAAREAPRLTCPHRCGAPQPSALPSPSAALSHRLPGVRGVGRRAEGC